MVVDVAEVHEDCLFRPAVSHGLQTPFLTLIPFAPSDCGCLLGGLSRFCDDYNELHPAGISRSAARPEPCSWPYEKMHTKSDFIHMAQGRLTEFPFLEWALPIMVTAGRFHLKNRRCQKWIRLCEIFQTLFQGLVPKSECGAIVTTAGRGIGHPVQCW